ncbi:unnamed protein product [Soboliphyme baturini]|uniref:Glutaredoxin domain-containing protein n=1 Tax=Soboliphyme baturini TaxID=241478 RepID=A0A183ITU1_9BILA|nr:unnamed protein product [Soboliphyme baturini]
MGNLSSSNVTETLETQIQKDPVVIYSKTTCGYCIQAKKLFDNLSIPYVSYELNKLARGHELFRQVHAHTGCPTVPQVFVCGKFVGACRKVLQTLEVLEVLSEELRMAEHLVTYSITGLLLPVGRYSRGRLNFARLPSLL